MPGGATASRSTTTAKDRHNPSTEHPAEIAAGLVGLLLAETLTANPVEQLDQLSSLSRFERGNDLLTELALECLPLLDMAPSRRGELDQRCSTIARCWSTH